MKAYIELDGRWYHVTVIELYTQQSLFGDTVKMVRFKKTKNAVGVLEARRDQFVDNKPSQSTRKSQEYRA